MFLYSSFPPFMLLFSQITAVYIVRPSDTIRYRILGWQFFLSAFEYVIPLSSGIHGFWWEFGCESYQGPLITHHFSLDFNILSLSFWKFAYDTLDLFEFILIGDLLWCVDLFFFFNQIWEVLYHYFFNYSSCLLLLLLLGLPLLMLVCLMGSHQPL